MRPLFLILYILWAAFLSSQSNCEIKNFELLKFDCFNSKFKVKINFEAVNHGNQGFKVQANGKLYGTFAYENLPIVIEGLDADCVTPYDFVIRDVTNPNCAASEEVFMMCCPPQDSSLCSPTIFNVKKSECLENAFYKLSFDIKDKNKPLGYDVFVNGVFHSFVKTISLPAALKINKSGLPYDKIVVCTNDKPGCCDTIEVASPCACHYEDIRTKVIDCNEEQKKYYLNLNFNKYSTSDSFYLGSGTSTARKYGYNQLPLTLGPFNFGEVNDLLILDKVNALCFSSFETKEVNHCIGCNIGLPTVEPTECRDGKLYIKLKFESSNTGVKGFTVQGGGIVYGTNFSYADSVHYLGPIEPNCTKPYEFVIKDNQSQDCKSHGVVINQLCCKECNLTDLKFESICEPRAALLYFNSSVDSVDLYINDAYVKTFKKGNDPLKVLYPFEPNKNYKIKITAKGDLNCNIQETFQYKCETECKILKIDYTASECDGESFNLGLDFTFKTGSTGKYNLKINGIAYGQFPYEIEKLTIKMEKVCDKLIIVATDAENPSCQVVIEKEIKICCQSSDCTIQFDGVDPICFEKKIIGFKLKVMGPEGKGYKLSINDLAIGLYKYSNTPIVIGVPNPLDPGVYTFTMIDIVNPDCKKTFAEDIACTTCSIKDITSKVVDCTEKTFKYKIGFNTLNSDHKFAIYINGEKLGIFDVSQLPVTSNAYDKMTDQNYIMKIIDATDESCRIEKELPNHIECISSSEDIDDHVMAYFNGMEVEVKSINGNPLHNLALYSIDGKLVNSKIGGYTIEKIEVATKGIFIIQYQVDGKLRRHLIVCK